MDSQASKQGKGIDHGYILSITHVFLEIYDMQDNVELKFYKSQAIAVTIKLSVFATCYNFNLKEIEYSDDKTDKELSMCHLLVCLIYCGCNFHQLLVVNLSIRPRKKSPKTCVVNHETNTRRQGANTVLRFEVDFPQ